MVDGGLRVGGGQVRPGVVPALVIVVLDIKAGELGEADSEGAAGVVDVLPIQRLRDVEALGEEPGIRLHRLRGNQAHQFSMLSCHSICKLDQSLELVVLGESDDLQNGAELGENLGEPTSSVFVNETKLNKSNDCRNFYTYLVEDIQGDGVEEVFHYDPQNGALGGGSSHPACVCRNGHASYPASVQGVDGLQRRLGALRDTDFLNRH